MNRNLLISLIVGAVIIFGGIGFFVISNNGGSNTETSNSTDANSTQKSEESVFDALPTDNLSFVATITTTEGDKTYSGLMEYDHNTKNVSYSSTVEGQETLAVYTTDAYYLCQNKTQCYKYPLNQIGSGSFDPESYKYSSEDFDSFKQSAQYSGVMDCPAGSCDVWKVTENGLETMIYIDKTSKRISQVEGKTPTGSSKIVYEFKDVSITPPANAQSIPNFQ